ncbi:MAG: xanthine dehydrogenase accessory protein XdhC [Betaproteobacteria bacterium]
MNTWLEDLFGVLATGQSAISIAVASTNGSVPREAGTRMRVTLAGVFGTIGGGHLEFKAIQIARDMLASGGAPALLRFPLGASLGQCCGGLVNLLFEPVVPDARWVNDIAGLRGQGIDCVAVTPLRGNISAGKLVVSADDWAGSLGSPTLDHEAVAIARHRLATHQASALLSVADNECFFEMMPAVQFNVVLFGAGHVGRAVVRILADLPCQVTWIDSREAEFPADIPHHVYRCMNEFPEEEVAKAPAGSYFLVMTHSHQLDQAISERILLRRDFAYFGLIGSLTKRRQFERRMAARGIPEARFAGMTCPIGIRAIDSKEPMAIAVGVVVEILQTQQYTARIAAGKPDSPTRISHSLRSRRN